MTFVCRFGGGVFEYICVLPVSVTLTVFNWAGTIVQFYFWVAGAEGCWQSNTSQKQHEGLFREDQGHRKESDRSMKTPTWPVKVRGRVNQKLGLLLVMRLNKIDELSRFLCVFEAGGCEWKQLLCVCVRNGDRMNPLVFPTKSQLSCFTPYTRIDYTGCFVCH